MISEPPFGGGRLLLDMSAYRRVDRPSVQEEWARALEADQVLITTGFRFEILTSARNHEEYEAVRAEIDNGFDIVPFDEETWDLAFRAQEALADHAPAYHRNFSPIDLLTAAAAHQVGVGVLHYDAHYDEIREHTELDFESRWIGRRGALDEEAPENPARAPKKAFNAALAQVPGEQLPIAYTELTEIVTSRFGRTPGA